ncbi:MAG: hypothetical protein HY391_01760 [Deltaproteobacteria bacterium]|nr:hypothetical protein [Deltaproteobacteria bacterium]
MNTQTSSRRHLYLINRPLQIKIIIILLLLGGLTTLWVGGMIYQTLRDIYSRMAAIHLHLNPEFINFLYSARKAVLLCWTATFVGTVLLLWRVGLFASHRIAGPLYALKRNLALAAKAIPGNPPFLSIRKRDEFHALKDAFNQALETCDRREVDARMRLKTIRDQIAEFQRRHKIDDRSSSLLAEMARRIDRHLS